MKYRWLSIALICTTGIAFAQSETKFIASDAAEIDLFGNAVGIDGDLAVVGAHWEDNRTGAAYVFARDGDGHWSEQAKLSAPGGVPYDNFGNSVAISGNTLVVGAEGVNNERGAVFIYTTGGVGSWSLEDTLTASDGAAVDVFGRSVAIEDGTILVGAEGVLSLTGAAYVFARGTGDPPWTEQEKLSASDGESGDGFGRSVAISGDTVVIGALSDDGSTGAAYVFARDTGDAPWTERDKLSASDGQSGDAFGVAVALQGDTAVVGAYGHEDFTGAAYVFVDDGLDDWVEKTRLTPADASPSDSFGAAVALGGGMVVIGADYENSMGAAYIFAGAGDTWTEIAKLIGRDIANADSFGKSVALSGDTAVIGAQGNDHAAPDAGAAYAFAGVSAWSFFRDGFETGSASHWTAIVP